MVVKKDGTTDNPPLQPPLIERNGDNFKPDKCPPKEGQGFKVIIHYKKIRY